MTKNLKRFNPRLVLNAIYNGIVAIDEEGKITYFNQSAERFFHIPAEQHIRRIQQSYPRIFHLRRPWKGVRV